MDQQSDNNQSKELCGVVRELVEVNKQIARSLANLESLYTGELQRQEEQRRELAEHQQGWKEQQKHWEEQRKRLQEEQEKLFAQRPGAPWRGIALLSAGLLVLIILIVVVQTVVRQLLEGWTK